MTREDLQAKYAAVIDEIMTANPVKEEDAKGNITGEHLADPDVCLDMLIADSRAKAEGRPIPYTFAGVDEFDFDGFSAEYATL